MRDDSGREVVPPATVPATVRLLEMLGDRFEVLEGFHPAFPDALTLVDRDTLSAVTLVIVESADRDGEPGTDPPGAAAGAARTGQVRILAAWPGEDTDDADTVNAEVAGFEVRFSAGTWWCSCEPQARPARCAHALAVHLVTETTW